MLATELASGECCWLRNVSDAASMAETSTIGDLVHVGAADTSGWQNPPCATVVR
jgi:hypothetical protein